MRWTVLGLALATTLACSHRPTGDPRLVGSWDLTVDPDTPPRYLFAEIRSGSFVFSDDGRAVRTLVIAGDPDAPPAFGGQAVQDGKTQTIETRYRGMHFAKQDNGEEWLAYEVHTPEGWNEQAGKTRLDGDDLEFFDLETRETLHFHRRR